MQARRDATLRLFRWMLASTIVVPATLFGYVAYVSYQNMLTLADERIERALDAVDEHATKVFQSLSVTLTSVDRLLAQRSDSEIVAARAELHQQLHDIDAQLPAVDDIWVLGRAGNPLVVSSESSAPTGFSVSDRDYFRAHLGNTDKAYTYVGAVLTPRLPRPPFFAVSRKRVTAEGSFAGVIVAVVNPSEFYKFYERLARQPGTNFTMVREDGVLLARYPGPIVPNVRLDANSGFMRSIARNREGGFYTTISQVDQSERRIAVRRLEGVPVYISTGLGMAELRHEWLLFLGSHLVFGVPATIALFLLVLTGMRRTESLYAEAARRVAAEETLRQSQKMEVVGQLTGGVAHDFNNLLTVIIGNIDMALRRHSEPKIERFLNNAMAGARRAAQLTQKLLAFSRRQPLDPRVLDPNRLLSDMSDLLKRTLGEQIAIETVIGAGIWRIEADPTELESAILNLALNARDAMPEGGKLTIELSNAFLDERYVRDLSDVKAGQYVLIAVSDTGMGMPADVVERAFEPFYTTKQAGQGTGLGLSQVYGFIKQSGGHIRIYSEPGQGTTIKMYLPRSDSPAAAADAGERRAERGDGETILVVEDDDGVRAHVAEILEDLGYNVLSAPTADEALAIIERAQQPVDLLLTDVVLPGMNGRELADAVTKTNPRMRVIFMTGYSRNAIVHHGRLDRGVALIQKPLSQEAVALKVREVLGSRG